MKVFDKHLIEELETELLNQYLNISWLADYLDDGFQKLKLDMFCGELDSKKGSMSLTVKDLLKALIDINVDITRKESLDSHLHSQSSFTVEERNRIYQEMVENCQKTRYEAFRQQYGYSISDLVNLLDQLEVLRSDLEKLNEKEQHKAYKEILHEYIGLDLLNYGFQNSSLKIRIAKGRSTQGEYQKIVRAKKKIFFDLLIEQVQQNKKKYPSVYKAVKENIDEVTRRFKIHDEEWIKSKLEVSRERVNVLHEEMLSKALTASKEDKLHKEIAKLSAFMEQLEGGSSGGYPFEKLKDILPFNTASLNEVLMKTLKFERNIKEQCIE
ncbi:TPA: hypothetical protein LUC54_001964 [Acinetobacter baumannii]|uniref:Uncharacterized protein n=3 Tax=Acinetobacter baumannii TaxID=470 RepID=A0ABX6CFE7_ACIB2|nr:hypothetical protein [Acinetobacter baumannii]AIL75011.1 hypothetical protein IX88_07415 [Acinetobacter baumannii]ARN31630.1 hypothetical protein A4U85_13035 [Acinetobacter baumannii]EEX02309.1 putative phage protein, HK97 gp10 family [Acinetobacter baumannii ATCC 19606 = CIP 70.34 = JCM 6841]EME52647.1 hypothetical protein G347_17489 [Acinetobacter baumannii MSP4-16]ENW74281.1 hypothetical protein F911_02789 [Acinetobacter baumannii ATCC 19606 = CIP 70.34 = JCM 6841]